MIGLGHRVTAVVFFSSKIETGIIRNSHVWPDAIPPHGNATMTKGRKVMAPITRAGLARFTMERLSNEDCYGKIYYNQGGGLTWLPQSFSKGE